VPDRISTLSRITRLFVALSLLAAFYPSGRVAAQNAASVQQKSMSLRAAIERVEAETAYRFLYRDAVIAGRSVAFIPPRQASDAGSSDAGSSDAGSSDVETSDAAWVESLSRAVRPLGLDLRVDTQRKQVLVVPPSTGSKGPVPDAIQGQVVDAETGTRLPLATLLWSEGGTTAGTATGDDGRFRIRLGNAWSSGDTLTVRASYVGFAPRVVRIPLSPPPGDVTIRLQPKQTEAPEVVVQTRAIVAELDTSWWGVLRAERYAPLGEANVMRALQPLPSIGITGAITSGLVVRGSRPDGFQVMLDGAPIYNAHHLFGLFDAFNADALQTVGLFYGIAPATYAAPPGGTLAFQTRTGSQASIRTTLHASSTALSGTVEGPWGGGRGSYLISARRSYLDIVDWMGNDALVAQGLDVDRPTEPLPGDAIGRVGERTTRALDPDASFYDVHLKAYDESSGGRRTTLSLYAGADDASQGLYRLVRDETDERRLTIDTARTKDRWGNASASLRIDQPLSDRAYGRVTLAGSRYYSRYRKDDFVYLLPRASLQDDRFNVAPFSNENTLYEGRAEVRADLALPEQGTAAFGAAGYYYDVTYREDTPLADPYDARRQTVRADVYGQLDTSPGPVDLSLGLRAHVYSDGNVLRLSPRLQARVWPDRPVSIGAGYTRSHQFLHRLDIVGETSSAVWVPSTDAQPPGRVDHLTAGVYVTPPGGTSLQVEAYLKAQENVRIHETIARLQRGDQSVLLAPWSANNRTIAQGLEVLGRQRLGLVSATAGYTWSRVDVDVPGGPTEPAPWDRRHQVTSRLEASSGGWSGALTGTYATGTPSDYAGVVAGEPERVGDTVRLDASIQYERSWGARRLRLRAAVYNLTDRANPWYRTPVLVWTRSGGPRSDVTGEYVILDTYDIGIQPSFAVTLRL